MMKFKKGIIEYHDYNLDIIRISGCKLFRYYIEKYFCWTIKLALILFPLIYLIYGLYYTWDTINYIFFDINLVQVFGIYLHKLKQMKYYN